MVPRMMFASFFVAAVIAVSPPAFRVHRDILDSELGVSSLVQVGGNGPALESQVTSRFFLRGMEKLELASCTVCPSGTIAIEECSVTADTVCEFQSCDGRETNPPDSARIYSTIHANQVSGVGHGQGRLDSDQAWSSGNNQLNSEFAQLDLGVPRYVANVLLQPRKGDAQSQRVKKYKVKFSLDGVTFNDVENGKEFVGNQPGEPDSNKVKGTFAKPILARYWRVVPTEFHGHMSLRWGVGICVVGSCTGVETNPPDARRTFSTIFANEVSGVGHGRSMLDSAQAWSSLNNNKNSEFMQLDLETNRKVSHVIIQARNQGGDVNSQRVTKFRVAYSRDGQTWLNVDAGIEFAGNPAGVNDAVKVPAFFSEPITARYWRLIPTDFVGHMSARWGVGVCN